MEEWLIFSSPSILIVYGIALFLLLFERKTRATHGVFTILSTILILIGSAFLLLSGGGLSEITALLTVFLLFTMGEQHEL